MACQSLFIEQVIQRNGIDEAERYDEGEKPLDALRIDGEGVLGHLATAIGEDISDFEAFDGPKRQCGEENKQPLKNKESHENHADVSNVFDPRLPRC